MVLLMPMLLLLLPVALTLCGLSPVTVAHAFRGDGILTQEAPLKAMDPEEGNTAAGESILIHRDEDAKTHLGSVASFVRRQGRGGWVSPSPVSAAPESEVTRGIADGAQGLYRAYAPPLVHQRRKQHLHQVVQQGLVRKEDQPFSSRVPKHKSGPGRETIFLVVNRHDERQGQQYEQQMRRTGEVSYHLARASGDVQEADDTSPLHSNEKVDKRQKNQVLSFQQHQGQQTGLQMVKEGDGEEEGHTAEDEFGVPEEAEETNVETKQEEAGKNEQERTSDDEKQQESSPQGEQPSNEEAEGGKGQETPSQGSTAEKEESEQSRNAEQEGTAAAGESSAEPEESMKETEEEAGGAKSKTGGAQGQNGSPGSEEDQGAKGEGSPSTAPAEQAGKTEGEAQGETGEPADESATATTAPEAGEEAGRAAGEEEGKTVSEAATPRIEGEPAKGVQRGAEAPATTPPSEEEVETEGAPMKEGVEGRGEGRKEEGAKPPGEAPPGPSEKEVGSETAEAPEEEKAEEAAAGPAPVPGEGGPEAEEGEEPLAGRAKPAAGGGPTPTAAAEGLKPGADVSAEHIPEEAEGLALPEHPEAEAHPAEDEQRLEAALDNKLKEATAAAEGGACYKGRSYDAERRGLRLLRVVLSNRNFVNLDQTWCDVLLNKIDGPFSEREVEFLLRAAAVSAATSRMHKNFRFCIASAHSSPPRVREGDSVLHAAVAASKPRLVELLLQYGAFPNMETLPRTTEHAMRMGQRPLHYAVQHQTIENIQAVLLLLQYGALIDSVDVRGRTPLMAAAGAPGPHIRRFIALLVGKGADLAARDHAGLQALHYAAAADSAEAVEALIRKGAPAAEEDMRGNTPLHYAAMFNAAKALRALLVHARDYYPDIDLMNESGKAAIHLAAAPRMMDGLPPSMLPPLALEELLLHHRANPTARDHEQNTPLIYAASGGYTQMVRALLQISDPGPELANMVGEALLQRAFNQMAAAHDGKTAYESAKESGRQDIALLLKDAASGLSKTKF